MAKSRFYGSSLVGDWVCAWSGVFQNELLRPNNLPHPDIGADPSGRRGRVCDPRHLETRAVEQRRYSPSLKCFGSVWDSRSLPQRPHSTPASDAPPKADCHFRLSLTNLVSQGWNVTTSSPVLSGCSRTLTSSRLRMVAPETMSFLASDAGWPATSRRCSTIPLRSAA